MPAYGADTPQKRLPHPAAPSLQALLAILDSPLNKAGKLKGLYVHTGKNVLIQVNPQVRFPPPALGSGDVSSQSQACQLPVLPLHTTPPPTHACMHPGVPARRCACRARSGASAACWCSCCRS